MAKSSVTRRRQKERFWHEWVNNNGSVCYYCKKEITRAASENAENRATIDHIVPLSKGGRNTLDNKVWSCRKCNEEKDNIRLY